MEYMAARQHEQQRSTDREKAGQRKTRFGGSAKGL